MRVPSVKNLRETFRDLDSKGANLVRRLAHMADDPNGLRDLIAEKCPATDKYARSCYNDPFNSHMWRATMALHAIDEVIGTHGVESLGPADDRAPFAPPYEYLNTGDPYTRTLIYKRATDALSLGCWGDIAEKHEDW